MSRAAWPFIGLLAGAVAGALWGWFGGDGYEANDSAIGTAFLCGLAGLLIGTIAVSTAARRDRRRR